MSDEASVSGPQVAAARALVGLTPGKFAALCGLSVPELQALEEGDDASKDRLEAVRGVLEGLGAVFLDERDGLGVGVRLKFGRVPTRAIKVWESEGGVAADDDIP
jgi:hypothetical protein